METTGSLYHNFFVLISFIASIAGLILLWDKPQKDDLEETERVLFRMSFSYWIVYCFAFATQKVILPDWETILLSLKITAVLSYLLTFSCILSLPLHKFAVHSVEE